MSPRRSASRTVSSLRASSRDGYGDQPLSPSIASTSTSAAYRPSRTSFVCRRPFMASSGENRRPGGTAGGRTIPPAEGATTPRLPPAGPSRQGPPHSRSLSPRLGANHQLPSPPAWYVRQPSGQPMPRQRAESWTPTWRRRPHFHLSARGALRRIPDPRPRDVPAPHTVVPVDLVDEGVVLDPRQAKKSATAKATSGNASGAITSARPCRSTLA